jgi:cyclopropane fatty-acyl-phospholipid synthase-like methyltransferase
LSKHIKDGDVILEVGCGNGFVAEYFARRLNVEIHAFDFSNDMIAIAKKRDLSEAIGTVSFFQADVTTHETSRTYDVIFSERCIQNLATWEEQKVALSNIEGWLKPGGSYVMLESFWTGLNNLNEARREVDLDPIPESWHNRFFVESDVLEHMEEIGLTYVKSDCFLSGYYFGSRVLLPKLLSDPSKAASTSILNDFFCALPAAGDFSPMKILQFSKPA